jgi:type IV pilus assembly protein PilB
MFGRRPTSSAAPPAPVRPGYAALADDGLPPELEPLWQPAAAAARQSVEALLLQRGKITDAQLTQARAVQGQTPGKTLVQILLSMNAAEEADILSALAETLGLSFEVPERAAVDPRAFALLPTDYVRKQSVLPLRFEQENGNKVLVVAMADPNNVFLLDEVKRRTRHDARMVVTPAAEINRLVEQLTSEQSDVQVDEIIKDIADDDITVVQSDAKDDVTDLEKMGSESPIIRFVNYLIFDAIKQGASDIHIEPKERALKVRYRIDGILFDAMNPPHHMHAAIVSRLKIMANLDISERRLPQDGRIRAMVHDRKVDLRMSTLPCATGEKVDIRILDNRSINVALEDLGFPEDCLTIWKKAIDEPHGILLVTGPSGWGMSTTLYTALS